MYPILNTSVYIYVYHCPSIRCPRFFHRIFTSRVYPLLLVGYFVLRLFHSLARCWGLKAAPWRLPHRPLQGATKVRVSGAKAWQGSGPKEPWRSRFEAWKWLGGRPDQRRCRACGDRSLEDMVRQWSPEAARFEGASWAIPKVAIWYGPDVARV